MPFKEGSLNVENANKMFQKLHGITLNSASTRNNAVLVKLGLIKLAREYQQTEDKKILSSQLLELDLETYFNDIPKAKEAI